MIVFGRARSSRLRLRLCRRGLAVLISAALALLWAAPGAGAVNRIYWGNCSANTVSFANLDGTGQEGDLNTTGATPNCPFGIAMDLLGGRIYWADQFGNTISFASLNGTGGGGELNTTGASTPNSPAGVATDPATGEIYWADSGSAPGSGGPLSFAQLNDTGGGGDLLTSGATLVNPVGVAIDPATGKIYWANSGANTISFANLNGSGGGDLNTRGAKVSSPYGVAIDPANGKIYWANRGNDTHPISFANLNDTGGGGNLNVSGATPSGAEGVAIDPEAGKIYWANSNANTISFANLDNTGGGGELNTTGASAPSGPAFPALLKAPLATARPKISGGSLVGSKLSCSTGTWAPDLLGSFLYQRPVSFSYAWSRNGTPISGATKNSITASSAGNYTCTVTATNPAGGTTQTSAEVAVAATATLSLRSKRKMVVYAQTTRLTGHLSSGKVGAVVKLQGRVWPFGRAYETVAKTRTGAHGAYSFKPHPSLATQYRVVAPASGAISGIRTIYVVKAFKVLGCEFTRPGYAHSACGAQRIQAGTYTLRITAEWIYPASVYAREKRKPVYTYYGSRIGSQKPPRTLTRQANVKQNANGARATIFRFFKKILIPPGTSYTWRMSACTKTTEPRDGFGLPGAPGSHRCGRATIPEKLPLSALG